MTSHGEAVVPSGIAARPSRPRRTLVLRIVLAVLVAAALSTVLLTNSDLVTGLTDAVRRADPRWLYVAVTAEIISITALARQQRQLLQVHGGRFSLRSVLATTYGGNAISTSLPVVGAAAATVFAFRRYTGLGAGRTVTGWALVMSGVYSSISLATVVATGAILTGHTGVAVTGILGLTFVVLPVVLLLIGIRGPRVRAVVERQVIRLAGVARRRIPRLAGRLREEVIVGGLEKIASFRLRGGAILYVLALSFLNWSADAFCLAAVLLALTGDVPWQGLLLVWAAGAGVSTLKLTPGGIGVVEAALTAALVGVGIPGPVALGSVLIYRAISLWFVAAVGVLTLILLRARRSRR